MAKYVDFNGPVSLLPSRYGPTFKYPVLDTVKDAEFIRFLEHPDEFNLDDIIRLRREYY